MECTIFVWKCIFQKSSKSTRTEVTWERRVRCGAWCRPPQHKTLQCVLCSHSGSTPLRCCFCYLTTLPLFSKYLLPLKIKMPKIVIHYFDFPFWRAEVSRLALHLGKVGIHFFWLNYFLCIINNTTILKNIAHMFMNLL